MCIVFVNIVKWKVLVLVLGKVNEESSCSLIYYNLFEEKFLNSG